MSMSYRSAFVFASRLLEDCISPKSSFVFCSIYGDISFNLVISYTNVPPRFHWLDIHTVLKPNQRSKQHYYHQGLECNPLPMCCHYKYGIQSNRTPHIHHSIRMLSLPTGVCFVKNMSMFHSILGAMLFHHPLEYR